MMNDEERRRDDEKEKMMSETVEMLRKYSSDDWDISSVRVLGDWGYSSRKLGLGPITQSEAKKIIQNQVSKMLNDLNIYCRNNWKPYSDKVTGNRIEYDGNADHEMFLRVIDQDEADKLIEEVVKEKTKIGTERDEIIKAFGDAFDAKDKRIQDLEFELQAAQNDIAMIKDFMNLVYSRVTRLEVIKSDEPDVGRRYVKWDCEIEPSFQDQGRTLKIFLKERKDG